MEKKNPDAKGKGLLLEENQAGTPPISKQSNSNEIQLLKLRVQNICCGKEAVLVKDNLKDVKGIVSVNVNVIGRIAYIKHNPSSISATTIITRLNGLHLGISLMESGTHATAEQDIQAKRRIGLRILSVAVQTIIFIAVIVGTVQRDDWDKWVAIPVLVIGGIPMVYRASIDIRKCVVANVNLLMLIAVAGTIALNEWLDACLIVYVFSVADLLLDVSYYKVDKSLSALLVSAPSKAVLAETNETVEIKDVKVGTVILVCAGEQIPLDGKVKKGRAAVDESSITGEATPVSKQADSTVFSGTVIQSGYLKIETTSDEKSSTLSRVSEYIEEAKAASSKTEELLNRFAKFYTPFIISMAFLTFIIPIVIAKVQGNYNEKKLADWSTRALKILVVACPCSLIVAVPVTMISGISRAAKEGVLIKGAQYLEQVATLQMFCFDKTGTLTEGRFQVVSEQVVYGESSDAVKYAAALETKSSHPVAAAIVNHFSGCITDKITEFGSQINLPEITKFKNEAGMGLSGVIEDRRVLVGNLDLMELFNVEIKESDKQYLKEWSDMGRTVVFVSLDEKLHIILGLADKVRESSKKAIEGLHDNGIRNVMLTGDSEGPAKLISGQVGIKEVSCSMKPHEKYEWLTDKQKNEKLSVAMVGDGINDCPSLAAADVGIAIGPTATGLAVDSAGITLMSDDLSRVVMLYLLAKHCRLIIYQNIVGSILVKVIFVFIALSTSGLLWLAVLADVAGLLFVIINGTRPLYFKHKEINDQVE